MANPGSGRVEEPSVYGVHRHAQASARLIREFQVVGLHRWQVRDGPRPTSTCRQRVRVGSRVRAAAKSAHPVDPRVAWAWKVFMSQSVVRWVSLRIAPRSRCPEQVALGFACTCATQLRESEARLAQVFRSFNLGARHPSLMQGSRWR